MMASLRTGTVHIFIVAILIAEVHFKQFLICTAVKRVEHSRQ